MTLANLMLAMLGLPILGAVAIMFAPNRLAKHIGFGTSLAVFALSVLFAVQFPDWFTGKFAPDANVLPELFVSGAGVTFTLGVDSVSLLLILLTTFLTPLSLLASYTAIEGREREFYGWFLGLLSAMLLAFMARDVIAFYVGYEFTIVPMMFLIAIFGGDDKRHAAVKFFVYTFVASVITLAGLIYVAARRADVYDEWTFSLTALQQFALDSQHGLSATERMWVFIALMVGFCVKVPFFPVHTWLPLAHNQAPTAGSVILAGTLLKLGTYGVYRIALPMAPDAAVQSVSILAILCVIAVVAISLVCLAQRDMKKLVAYSSVAHMGVCMLGMFALNPTGVSGAVLYMINHGLSTGALFLCIGMMYERYHTKDMDQIGGLAKVMPIWAFFVVFFMLTSVALPGLNGFVSELLCLLGAFSASPNVTTGWPGILGPKWMIVAGVGSVIFGAMYMLFMVGRVVWGPLKLPGANGHGEAGHGAGHGSGHGTRKLSVDLSWREIAILTPIAVVCLALGLRPYPVLDVIVPSVKVTIADYPAAVREHLAEVKAGQPPLAAAEPTTAPSGY